MPRGEEGAQGDRRQVVVVKLALVDPQKLECRLARRHRRRARELGGGNRETVIDFVVGPRGVVPHMLHGTEVGSHMRYDPEFLADAEQAKLDVLPNPGPDTTKAINDVLALPPDMAAKLADILK